MEVLKAVLQIVYIGICIALVVIVLKQEGDSTGLSGAITGSNDNTYWNKIKGRSKEGLLDNATKVLAALFIVLSLVLDMM